MTLQRPLLFFLWLACACFVSSAIRAAEEVSFNRDVRRILSNNCFYCHGPDDKHREADLRLDTFAGATADLGGYAAIVPGKPDKSLLLARVTTDDADEIMPPVHSKKGRLPKADVEILRRWIEQGAQYQGHWAFEPLAKMELPKLQDETWVRNPIDRFILERLQREGMTPSAEADRGTLIRRVSLDLTGLLPSPAETAEFMADRDPLAYEKLVDRLLSSPHYGERWGRHWLDQARYADSNGFSIDGERTMWPYRDWVIAALNRDMPFDQFTVEQLAGDLLPKPTKPQLVATGFHRNTLINEEGGTDREQFRHEAVIDRVNTTGTVWLGLTVGCAQCHTHKFDPISHREYYELSAFFNHGTDVNNKGATVPVKVGEMFGTPVERTEPEPPTKAELAKSQAAWEQAEIARLDIPMSKQATWSPANYVEYDTKSGAGFRLLPDNSLLADGKGSDNDTYRIVATTSLERIAAIRLRVLTHDSLPKKGPGLASNGNFVLTRLTLTADGREQKFSRAAADHEQPGYSIAGVLDDKPTSGWGINIGKGSTAVMNADHEAVIVLEKPLEVSGKPVELQIFHELNQDYLLGRFAFEFTNTIPNFATPAEVKLLAALKSKTRSAEQKKLISETFRQANEKLAGAKKSDPGPSAMIMQDLATPRETYLKVRGDFTQPDKKLGPLFPGGIAAISPQLPAAANRTRKDLAEWLIHPDNPLTPRVTMNRIWMRYFGRGLVETEEDFGTQGTPPTHPELLDWLAGEFIRQKWSMKAMHRLIVTSSTYRQASALREEYAEKDPRNLLLARQERVRLEGETLRDAALVASGLFDATIGGPSVRPPQPAGVYAFTQNAKSWKTDSGPARFRRGMYTFFFRSAPYPLLTTFDAPDFQTTCTRRGRSNTPLQALTLANDEAFLELTRGMAARIIAEVPDEDLAARIRHAYRVCLSRDPTAKEAAVLSKYYASRLAAYKEEPALASQLLASDLKQFPSPEVGAALFSVCRAILNSDNFITRE